MRRIFNRGERGGRGEELATKTSAFAKATADRLRHGEKSTTEEKKVLSFSRHEWTRIFQAAKRHKRHKENQTRINTDLHGFCFCLRGHREHRVFSQLCVLGNRCSESKLSPQSIAFVHRRLGRHSFALS